MKEIDNADLDGLDGFVNDGSTRKDDRGLVVDISAAIDDPDDPESGTVSWLVEQR